MKKIVVLIVSLLIGLVAYAQDDAQKAAADAAKAIAEAPQAASPKSKPNYWNDYILTKLDFGQTSLTNWAAGGYNSTSLKSFVDANANYAKGNMAWNNRLQLDYGFIYSDDKPFIQKSDDRIYFESKWGYKAAKNLNYSARFSFKSQFSNSYTYPVPKTDGSRDPLKSEWMAARLLKSGLMSPAYTDLGFGIDWIPSKWLSVNVAPITGGFVIVHNECLRPTYSMSLRNLDGQEKIYYDAAVAKTYANAIEKGKAIGQYYRGAKFEFGAKVTADAKIQVNDNFKYSTQLVLFSDYLDHPENLRVNWDNRFDWKLAKYFSMTFTTNMIYDDKVYIIQDKDVDKYPNGRRRIQFKESLSFGFAYTISSKKK